MIAALAPARLGALPETRPARLIAGHRADRGSTALLLSGGGNMTFFHLGVARVLLSHGLLPKVLSGASAGSVIGGLLATRTDRELDLLHEDEIAFVGLTERPAEGGYSSQMVADSIAAVIPDVTFSEAEEISGRALNISLAAQGRGGIVCGPRTTPHVLVRDAIRASCAVPFVFEPVVVHERRRGQVQPFRSGQGWVDGCLYADVPAQFIKLHYQVRHTIVSLVNPAVRPFVADAGPKRSPTALMWGVAMRATRQAALGFAHVGRFTTPAARARDIFTTACRIMQQRYDGDLVLTPSRRLAFSDLLDHPTPDLVRKLARDGEVRTHARLAELQALGRAPVPAPRSIPSAFQPAPAFGLA